MELVVDDPGLEGVLAHYGGVRLSEVTADDPDIISTSIMRLQSHGKTIHRLRTLLLADKYDPSVLVADQGDMAVAILGRGLVDAKEFHTGQVHPVQGLIDPVHDGPKPRTA